MSIIAIVGGNRNVTTDKLLADLQELKWITTSIIRVTHLTTNDSNRKLAGEVQALARLIGIGCTVKQIQWEYKTPDGKTVPTKGALYSHYKDLPKEVNAILCYPGDTDNAVKVLIEECGKLKPKPRTIICRRCDPVAMMDIMDMPVPEPITEDESRALGFPEGEGGTSTGNFDGEQERIGYKVHRSPGGITAFQCRECEHMGVDTSSIEHEDDCSMSEYYDAMNSDA